MLLWEEYKSIYPEGYQYSQFCHLYHHWRRQIDPVMRQEHRAGEALFVDWAGMTVDIVDPATADRRPASIFVAAMGASSYTYAEATLSQELCDWIGATVGRLPFSAVSQSFWCPTTPKPASPRPAFTSRT